MPFFGIIPRKSAQLLVAVALAVCCTKRLDNRFDNSAYACGLKTDVKKKLFLFRGVAGSPVSSTQGVQVSFKGPDGKWSEDVDLTPSGCVVLDAGTHGTLAMTHTRDQKREGIIVRVTPGGGGEINNESLKLVSNNHHNVWRDCGDWAGGGEYGNVLFGKLVDPSERPLDPDDLVALLGSDDGNESVALSLSELGCVAVPAPLQGFLWAYSPRLNLAFSTDFSGMSPGIVPRTFVLKRDANLSLISRCGQFSDPLPEGARVVKVLGANNHEILIRDQLEAFLLGMGENATKTLNPSTRGCVAVPSKAEEQRLLLRVKTQERIWALTVSLKDVLADSDPVLKLKDFSRSNLRIDCDKTMHVQSSIMLPLDLSESVDFASYSLTATLLKQEETQALAEWNVTNPTEVLHLDPTRVKDGQYQLRLQATPLFHVTEPARWQPRTCNLVVDTEPPTFTIDNEDETDLSFNGDLVFKPFEVIPLKVDDTRSATVTRYCFVSIAEADTTLSCEMKRFDPPVRAPEGGDWQLRIVVEDSAGNAFGSETDPVIKTVRIRDKDRLTRIRLGAVAVVAFASRFDTTSALFETLAIADEWHQLKTESERGAVRNDIVRAYLSFSDNILEPIAKLENTPQCGEWRHLDITTLARNTPTVWTCPVRFSADGRFVFFDSDDSPQAYWSLNGKRHEGILESQPDWTRAQCSGTDVSWDPLNERLTIPEEQAFKVKDSAGNLLWQAPVDMLVNPHFCHFSPDGSLGIIEKDVSYSSSWYGDSLYFVTEGRLLPEELTAMMADERALYAWRSLTLDVASGIVVVPALLGHSEAIRMLRPTTFPVENIFISTFTSPFEPSPALESSVIVGNISRSHGVIGKNVVSIGEKTASLAFGIAPPVATISSAAISPLDAILATQLQDGRTWLWALNEPSKRPEEEFIYGVWGFGCDHRRLNQWERSTDLGEYEILTIIKSPSGKAKLPLKIDNNKWMTSWDGANWIPVDFEGFVGDPSEKTISFRVEDEFFWWDRAVFACNNKGALIAVFDHQSKDENRSLGIGCRSLSDHSWQSYVDLSAIEPPASVGTPARNQPPTLALAAHSPDAREAVVQIEWPHHGYISGPNIKAVRVGCDGRVESLSLLSDDQYGFMTGQVDYSDDGEYLSFVNENSEAVLIQTNSDKKVTVGSTSGQKLSKVKFIRSKHMATISDSAVDIWSMDGHLITTILFNRAWGVWTNLTQDLIAVQALDGGVNIYDISGNIIARTVGEGWQNLFQFDDAFNEHTENGMDRLFTKICKLGAQYERALIGKKPSFCDAVLER